MWRRGSPSLYIDPDLVTQVLLNVTLNAVQAMPERRRAALRGPQGPATPATPQSRPSRERPPRASRAPGSAWIEYQQVRVIDTGTGIPRGVLAKMFDPFFTTKAQRHRASA